MDYGMMIGVNTPASGRLPEGYTELEYLESTGTQYINSGYNIQSGDSIEVLGQVTGLSSDAMFFEVTSTTTNRCLAYLWGSNTDGGTFEYIYGNGNKAVSSFKIGLETDIEIIINSNCIVNGVNLGSVSVPTQTRPVYLFAGNDIGTVARLGKVRIKRFKITNSSGVVQLDYIPARRNSDGVLGMYNTVDGSFKTNAGTGTFVAGSALGVDVAREVEQIYTESDLVAREVTEGWVEVGLVARKFFSSTIYPITYEVSEASYITHAYEITPTSLWLQTGCNNSTWGDSSWGNTAICLNNLRQGDVVTVDYTYYVSSSVGGISVLTQERISSVFNNIDSISDPAVGTYNKVTTWTMSGDGEFIFKASMNNSYAKTVKITVNSITVNGSQVFPY